MRLYEDLSCTKYESIQNCIEQISLLYLISDTWRIDPCMGHSSYVSKIVHKIHYQGIKAIKICRYLINKRSSQLHERNILNKIVIAVLNQYRY